MRDFNPETDSVYLLKWFLDLTAEPEEFANLFTAPSRNLAAIGNWAINNVKLFIETDSKGIWFAGWMAPMLTGGAEVGMWIRPDRRPGANLHRAVDALKIVDAFYDHALSKASCIIGLTKQNPALHNVHLRLGYTYVDEFPGVFDGDSVFMYKMTRESRAARTAVISQLRESRRARYHELQRGTVQEQQLEQPVESLRGDPGEVRYSGPESGAAGFVGAVGARIRSIKNWWGDEPDSNHQPPG